MVIACANAKPAILAPAAAAVAYSPYSSPFIAAAAPAALPFVTATSSQVVRTNATHSMGAQKLAHSLIIIIIIIV